MSPAPHFDRVMHLAANTHKHTLKSTESHMHTGVNLGTRLYI